jgi:hypothetical protein
MMDGKMMVTTTRRKIPEHGPHLAHQLPLCHEAVVLLVAVVETASGGLEQ